MVVEYLSTFFYTYLPVNIHFQLIIITNISILTDPAYFVPPSCHCGILALRSRDFRDVMTLKINANKIFQRNSWRKSMRKHKVKYVSEPGLTYMFYTEH